MLRLLMIICALFSISALAIGADFFTDNGGIAIATRLYTKIKLVEQVSTYRTDLYKELTKGRMSQFSKKNKALVLEIMRYDIAPWKIRLLDFYSKNGFFMLNFPEENQIIIIIGLEQAFTFKGENTLLERALYKLFDKKEDNVRAMEELRYSFPQKIPRSEETQVYLDHLDQALTGSTLSKFSTENKEEFISRMTSSFSRWKAKLLEFYSENGPMQHFSERNKMEILKTMDIAHMGWGSEVLNENQSQGRTHTDSRLVIALSFFDHEGKFSEWTEEEKVQAFQNLLEKELPADAFMTFIGAFMALMGITGMEELD